VSSEAALYPSNHSLIFEEGIPTPDHIPDADDELRAFLKTNHKGLSRIAVKLQIGRKRFVQLNSLSIGATYGETPQASVDQIARAIMSIGQDYFEQHDELAKFMVQASVYKKASGDPARRATHFEIGRADGFGGDSYAAPTHSNEAFDELLVRQQQVMFDRIMEQNKTIAAMGEKAIGMMSDVFVAKEEALQARAEANAVAYDAKREDAEAKRRDAKWERGFKMLEKGFNTGLGQLAVNAAQQKLGSSSPAGIPSTAQIPSTPKPAWARAAQGEKVEVPAVAAPAVEAPAPAALEAPSEEELPDELTQLKSGPAADAVALYRSITAEQWPVLATELTKKQFKLLRTFAEPESDETALAAVFEFKEGLKESAMSAIMGIMTAEQVGSLIGLVMAADVAQDDDEADDD
jgi:hypothetical protein